MSPSLRSPAPRRWSSPLAALIARRSKIRRPWRSEASSTAASSGPSAGPAGRRCSSRRASSSPPSPTTMVTSTWCGFRTVRRWRRCRPVRPPVMPSPTGPSFVASEAGTCTLWTVEPRRSLDLGPSCGTARFSDDGQLVAAGSLFDLSGLRRCSWHGSRQHRGCDLNRRILAGIAAAVRRRR